MLAVAKGVVRCEWVGETRQGRQLFQVPKTSPKSWQGADPHRTVRVPKEDKMETGGPGDKKRLIYAPYCVGVRLRNDQEDQFLCPHTAG